MSILIVGATRGLGACLVNQYARQGKTVYGTSRSAEDPSAWFASSIEWLRSVDLMEATVGDNIANQLKGKSPLDVVVRILPFPEHHSGRIVT